MVLTRTKRLIIRDWEKEDFLPYASLVADHETMQFIGDGKPQIQQQAETYIIECIENRKKYGWSRFAVELISTGEFIGFCGFKHYNQEIDFGWRYARKFWGKGYGTEAAEAVFKLGIHQFQFPRIVCIAYTANIASIKIIEKLGLNYEKEIAINNTNALQYAYTRPVEFSNH